MGESGWRNQSEYAIGKQDQEEVQKVRLNLMRLQIFLVPDVDRANAHCLQYKHDVAITTRLHRFPNLSVVDEPLLRV